MSISDQILRIQTARNTIRNKLVSLGLATSTADIDDCATAVDGIVNRGAVSAQVKEGVTYTIPAGYHNGSGTVSGVAGGGNYSLQSKTATPTKAQQSITPDSGYYGLSDVTVGAIPENYQDVSAVTATAADVLANKVIVDATGKSIAGTMPNNGNVQAALFRGKTYTIPSGYHSGGGLVEVASESKEVTPTKAKQTIAGTVGVHRFPDGSSVSGYKLLNEVVVNPIPDAYQDITSVTATASDVLSGKSFVASDGSTTKGAMPNNGTISKTINGLSATSTTIPAGYTSGGTVSLTNDIETALAAI